jgi:hypothetical protein
MQMAEKLPEVATPINRDKVHAENVVATVRACRVTLTPPIETSRANHAMTTGENGRIFREIKAEQAG